MTEATAISPLSITQECIIEGIKKGDNIFCNGIKMNNGKHYQIKVMVDYNSTLAKVPNIEIVEVQDREASKVLKVLKVISGWFSELPSTVDNEADLLKKEVEHTAIYQVLFNFNNDITRIRGKAIGTIANTTQREKIDKEIEGEILEIGKSHAEKMIDYFRRLNNGEIALPEANKTQFSPKPPPRITTFTLELTASTASISSKTNTPSYESPVAHARSKGLAQAPTPTSPAVQCMKYIPVYKR